MLGCVKLFLRLNNDTQRAYGLHPNRSLVAIWQAHSNSEASAASRIRGLLAQDWLISTGCSAMSMSQNGHVDLNEYRLPILRKGRHGLKNQKI